MAYIHVPFLGPPGGRVFADLSGMTRGSDLPTPSPELAAHLTDQHSSDPSYPTSLRLDRGPGRHVHVALPQIADVSDGFTLSVDARLDSFAVPGAGPGYNGNDIAYSPDGTLLAVAHSWSPYLTVYNAADMTPVLTGEGLIISQATGVMFNHVGTQLAVAHHAPPYLTVLNVADWSTVELPSGLLVGDGKSVAFNHDDSLLAVASWGGSYLTVLDTATWDPIAAGDPPPNVSNDVAFSADGSMLAVAHNTAPFVTVYLTATWTKATISTANRPPNTANGVAFNPDGTRLAIGHNSSPFLTVLNTATWTKVSTSPAHIGSSGRRLAYTPDGSRLTMGVSGSPGALVINTGDWSTEMLKGNVAFWGNAAVISPDGETLAVAHNHMENTGLTTFDTDEWWMTRVLSESPSAVLAVAKEGEPLVLEVAPGGQVRLVEGGAVLAQSDPGTVSVDTWYRLQIDWDGANAYVYRNGEYLFQVPRVDFVDAPDTVRGLELGARSGDDTTMEGYANDLYFTDSPEYAVPTDHAPTGPRAGLISGAVSDGSAPVQRQINVHRSEGGWLVGQAVANATGLYACWVTKGVDHYIVQLSDIDENALIYTNVKAE